MKPNDGCALQKLVGGRWRPLAIRYQRFSTAERRLLDLGQIVTTAAGAQIRRYNWAERQALIRVMRI